MWKLKPPEICCSLGHMICLAHASKLFTVLGKNGLGISISWIVDLFDFVFKIWISWQNNFFDCGGDYHKWKFQIPRACRQARTVLEGWIGFAEYFSIQKSLDSKIRYEIPCRNQSLPTLYIDSWAIISYQAFMIKQRSQIWARKKIHERGKLFTTKFGHRKRR